LQNALRRGEIKIATLPTILTSATLASSYAPSDLFVLLSWSCGLYSICLKTNPDFPETQSWRVLVGILATLFDMILSSIIAKASLKHGAFVRVRRAIRSVCGDFSYHLAFGRMMLG
jgi:hypothetical protein